VGSYDLAVIGLGAWGSAALMAAAAKFGEGAVGYEQFELGHARGASEDHSRIIRYSYHHPDYVALASRAYADWADLERASAERLVHRTGGLDFFPPDAAGSLSAYQQAMSAHGVDFEVMEPAEVKDRFPAFSIDDDVITLFQADSGLVAAARATRAMRAQAEGSGAAIRPHSRVTEVRAGTGGFEIQTEDGTDQARHLVVTADAWTNRLLEQFDLRVNLEVRQEQVAYFRAGPSFSSEEVPVWIWISDPSFYGLPSLEGTGLKIGQDVGGRPVGADDRSFDPDPAYSRRLRDFMSRLIPSGWDETLSEKTCLYTLTPDRDLVLDRLPGHPGAAVGLGAAHGFKFSPTAGRVLVDLATGEDPGLRLDLFRADRPILSAADPPTNYLV
jgi:sarcosine oxidase